MAGDDERRTVLHALRLTSLATTESITARSGLTTADTTAVLTELAGRGWVIEQSGRLAGWSLTGAGRSEGERLLVLELDSAGARPEVERAYGSFLEVNSTFLELCTRWQLVSVDGTEQLNDHLDQARDAQVLADLATVHDVVVRISDDLATTLDRFGGYRPRFEHTMSRLEANDVDWFTKPLIDSYHSVWFELHEDLLATLGRDRTSERPTGARTEGKS